MAPKKRVPQWQFSSNNERNKDEGARASIWYSPTRITSMSSISAQNISFKKIIDFQFLEIENFEIERKIKNLDWQFFCEVEVPIYMNIVREFYQNIKFGDSHVSSRVKGKIIDFNDKILSNTLILPSEGILEDDTNARESKLGYIIGREVGQFEKVQAQD